jgi:predicted transposase YbfD/YdcC
MRAVKVGSRCIWSPLGRPVSASSSANEIVAIPLLLERLELTGALVTIDAMGTQTDIAEKIVGRGGDYLLALKANRPVLHRDVG